MAAKVALWPEQYGCDGIDLDIEDGAGDAAGAGPNMIHFIKKLRELNPKMIIGQPTYGFPAVRNPISKYFTLAFTTWTNFLFLLKEVNAINYF